VAYALYEVLRDVTNNKVDPQVMCFNCLLDICYFPISLVIFFNTIFHSILGDAVCRNG
jgi:hypothetical protein